MIIYVDLILVINFIIDLFILMGVSSLLKRKVKFIRIILSSLFGSISTLLLFYIDNNYLLLIYKLLVSIGIVLISFKYISFKYFKDNLIWLYIISIILGGGLYLLSDTISLNNKGLIFSSNGLKINLFLLIIISPFIIYKYIKTNKNYQITYSNYYDISIYYDDVIINGIGFLDTGNNLKDIYFNRPIILIDKSLIKHHIKTYLVPFNTVNSHDLLEVFKPKKIVIEGKSIKNISIGLSNINIDGVKIILNKEAL